jgi:prepilin-type N-terminal cleavage/methylation domain-containing protein
VRERGTILNGGVRDANSQRGFSMIELSVVIMLILIISAMAMIAYLPTLQDARFDTAMRQILDQLRQAREYALTNRRYVQVTFPTIIVGTQTEYLVVLTERNDLTVGAGAVDPVLSSLPIQYPAQYTLVSGIDTPDGFSGGVPTSPIMFEGLAGGPVGGILFQSDGELVDGTTFQPINGTVFIGYPGKSTTARAVTVLGGTGRVRGWKGTGPTWFRF